MKAAVKGLQAGFTLVEAVVTIVIISASLVTVIYAWRTTAVHSADSIVQAKTAYLAEMFLEEIIFKAFDENTGQGGLPRCTASSGSNPCSTTFGADSGESSLADFDDVDDYHGQTLTYAGLHGSSSGAYSNYSAVVSVSYAGADFGYASHLVKKVVVTVTPPGESVGYPFSAYKGNY